MPNQNPGAEEIERQRMTMLGYGNLYEERIKTGDYVVITDQEFVDEHVRKDKMPKGEVFVWLVGGVGEGQAILDSTWGKKDYTLWRVPLNILKVNN